MAQVNSVQREPSMEEILASIRRIIEDSDGARKILDEEDEAGAVEADSSAASEMEAFREELTAQPEARPVGVADIQQIGAEREPRFESRPAKETWPKPADFVRYPEPEGVSDEVEGEGDESPVHLASSNEPAAHEGNGNTKPAILSEHAGRQVAASFGELSEIFAASRRKSFDEMAEDMMRPMLQEWLDNNLPLLVERLVREEIERVARGGAR